MHRFVGIHYNRSKKATKRLYLCLKSSHMKENSIPLKIISVQDADRYYLQTKNEIDHETSLLTLPSLRYLEYLSFDFETQKGPRHCPPHPRRNRTNGLSLHVSDWPFVQDDDL